MQALGPTPPARRTENGMLRRAACGQVSQHCHQSGGARPWGAQVEDSWLIMGVLPRHEAVPVVGAQQGPGGHSPNIDPVSPLTLSRLPHLRQPAHLLLSTAAEM